MYPMPQYLQTKINLKYLYKFSPLRAVGTQRSSYKTQSVDIVYVNNLCLFIKGKVKCTLVQALRLCTGRTAHSGSLPFHDRDTIRG